MSKIKTVPVVIDKSHLVTIGEKLYSEKIDFIRELVNNAYDADASTVWVTASGGEIRIQDNGTGMNYAGLSQYFRIGSEEKREHPISPKYKRQRIGEFGIGKFAALSAAKQFTIITQKGNYRARMTFSKQKWNKSQNWELPIEEVPANPLEPDGTTIILTEIEREFKNVEIVRILREKVPLHMQNFHVYLNGSEISQTSIPGRRIPIHKQCKFGKIEGEIIIINQKGINLKDKAGLQIKVKGVTIKRELFGLASHNNAMRIRGSVEANFLPITSNRDNFIRDSLEYRLFEDIMIKEFKKVFKTLRTLADKRSEQRISKALRTALDLLGKALRDHPELQPSKRISEEAPLGIEDLADTYFGQEDLAEGYDVSKPKYEKPAKNKLAIHNPEEITTKKRKRSVSLGERTIVRRLRLKDLGIVCRMEQFGKDERPVFTESGIVFINTDHPLYKKIYKDDNLLSFYLATLISQELAAHKIPDDTQQALSIQNKILTGAFG